MKKYIKPTIDIIVLKPEEQIANPHSGKLQVKRFQNNGWGNGDDDAPGNSLFNNGAENEQD